MMIMMLIHAISFIKNASFREPCFKEAVEAKSSFFLVFSRPVSRNSRAYVISVFIILQQLLCSLSAPSVDLICVSTACFMQQFKSS